MKIKTSLAALALVGLVSSANALTLGDSRSLGYIGFSLPAGNSDITAYVDHLRLMAVSTSDSALGQSFTRSGNAFSPLDAPVLGPRANYPDPSRGQNTWTVDLGAGHMYLWAKYDGPNYGAVVWYVAGLTGEITIPAFPTGDKYALSGTALFNPTPSRVPDGGTTAMLLGVALSGLAMLRRVLS